MGDLSLGLSLSRRATSSATPDVPETITSLVVSDQDGSGDVSGGYSISADATVHFVVATGFPNSAQVAAGQDQTGSAAPISSTDTWTTPAGSVVVDIPDDIAEDTYYLSALVDGDSTVVVSNAFTLAPTAAEVWTTTAPYTGASSTTHDITVDFSGRAEGEGLLVLTGRMLYPTATPTIDGSSAAMTEVATSGKTAIFGRQIAAYEYVIEAGKNTTVTFSATQSTARDERAVGAINIPSGLSPADTDRDHGGSEDQLTGSVSVTNASNRVVLMYMGDNDNIAATDDTHPPTIGGDLTFSEVERVRYVSGGLEQNILIAIVENAATGTHSITVDGFGSAGARGDDGHAFIAVVLE